jgi:hypothetical protein
MLRRKKECIHKRVSRAVIRSDHASKMQIHASIQCFASHCFRGEMGFSRMAFEGKDLASAVTPPAAVGKKCCPNMKALSIAEILRAVRHLAPPFRWPVIPTARQDQHVSTRNREQAFAAWEEKTLTHLTLFGDFL